MSGGARRMIGLAAIPSLVLLMSVFVNPASAVVVACGQTITQSTVLTADVGPCPNNGIIIGASNITLDLGGHRVFGTPNPGDGAGILINRQTGVRVQNGTVSNFDGGVVILGGGGNTVTGLRVIDNIGSSQTAYADGILIFGSSNNVVSRNQVIHNGYLSGISISRDDTSQPGVLTPSNNNLIDSNLVANNNVLDPQPPNPEFGAAQEDNGIRIETGNSFNTVSNNTVTGSGLDGIHTFFQANQNTIRRNNVANNGFHGQPGLRPGNGILVDAASNRNRIEENTATGNAGNGIFIRGGTVLFNPNNVILRNRAFNNGKGPNPTNLPLFDLHDSTGPTPCDNNEYHGNQAGTFHPPCVLAP